MWAAETLCPHTVVYPDVQRAGEARQAGAAGGDKGQPAMMQKNFAGR